MVQFAVHDLLVGYKMFVEEHPRDRLSSYYGIEGSIPSSIQQILQEKWQKQNETEKSQSEQERERAVIDQIFKDKRVTMHQKEQIAMAIITGEFSSSNMNLYGGYGDFMVNEESDYDRMKKETRAHINRHSFQHPSHLEIIGSTSTIPQVVPKDLYEHSQSFRKNFNIREGYTWGSEFIEAEETPIVKLRPKSATVANKVLSLSAATVKAKEDYLSKKKQIERILREENEKVRLREQEGMERRRELKKKLSEFRKKIYERLRERNDHNMGAIMRAVDEGMAFHFMEKFHGYSMTVDSIIEMIGSMLGSDNLPASTISPEECFNIHEDNGIFKKSGVNNPAILRGEEQVNTKLSPSKAIPWNYGHQAPTSRVSGSGFRSHSPKKNLVRVLPAVRDVVVDSGGSVFGGMSSIASAASDSLFEPTVEDAMNAIRDELDMEALYPPVEENVLSDKQIEDLGTHKKNFEQVARAIDKQNELILMKKRKARNGIRPIGNFSRNNSKRSDPESRNTEPDFFLGLVITQREKDLVKENNGIDPIAYPPLIIETPIQPSARIDDDIATTRPSSGVDPPSNAIDNMKFLMQSRLNSHTTHSSAANTSSYLPEELSIHGDSWNNQCRRQHSGQSDPVILDAASTLKHPDQYSPNPNFTDMAHHQRQQNRPPASRTPKLLDSASPLEGHKSQLISRTASGNPGKSTPGDRAPPSREVYRMASDDTKQRTLDVRLPVTVAKPIGHCNHDSLTISASLNHSLTSVSSSIGSSSKNAASKPLVEHVGPIAKPKPLAPRALKTKERFGEEGQPVGPAMPYYSQKAAYDVLCGGVPAGVGLTFVDRTKLRTTPVAKVKPGTISVMNSRSQDRLSSVANAPI